MADLKFTTDHEVVYIEGDLAWVGITEYAREALGDLVFVELPEVGKQVEKGSDVAVVESVKTAAEVYAPIDGEVVEVNEALESDFDLLSTPLEQGGWIAKLKISNAAQLEELMDRAAYGEYLKTVD